MTDVQAAVASSRRAGRGVLARGWAATLILVIGPQFFAPALRPFVLIVLCGGLTAIVAKRFTGYGRVWTYLLIAELWCVTALLYTSALTRALPLAVAASAVAPVVCLLIAAWNWAVELAANLQSKGHSLWFLSIVFVNAALACVLSMCVAFTLKLVQYNNPAENVDPCLVWLSRSLFLLAVVKVGLWWFLTSRLANYQRVDDWLGLTNRVVTTYCVPVLVVTFIVVLRPKLGLWPAVVAIVASLLVTGYNSVNAHRVSMDPVPKSEGTAGPVGGVARPADLAAARIGSVAQEASCYSVALQAAEDTELRLREAVLQAHARGRSVIQIARAAKMKRHQIQGMLAQPR